MSNNNMRTIRGKMENSNDLVLRKVQAKVTQQIYGGLILLVVGLMWFNSQAGVFAGLTNTIDTNIVITAGTLALLNGDTALQFEDVAVGGGTASNVLDNHVVSDLRGAANSYWSVRVNGSNLNSGGDANTILASTIKVYPGNATITNVATWDGTKIGIGEGNDVEIGTLRNIFNSTYNAPMTVRINGLRFDVPVPGTIPAGTYSGTFLLTLLASDGT